MAYETEDKSFFLNLDIEDVERFDMSKFMLYSGDVYDPITSFALETIPTLRAGGKKTVQGLDFRPDQLSFEIYGSTQYWWVLIIYNGLQSFNEIVHGQELRYPSVSALEDFFFNLKIQQSKSDKE